MTYTIFNTFRPYDFGTDAIERQRVSLGQSIIDADFEYGLQATKWQIYQDIRKSPSMFEIPGTDLSISSVMSDGQTPSLITSQMTSTLMTPTPLIAASNVIANQILLISSATVVGASGLVTITTASHGIAIGQVFPLTVYGTQAAVTNNGTINGTYNATVATATTFTYYVSPNTVSGSFTTTNSYVYVPLQQTVNNQTIVINSSGVATVTPAFPHNFLAGNVFQTYIGNIASLSLGNVTSGVYTCTAINTNSFTFQTTAKTGTYTGFEAGTTQYLSSFAFQAAPGVGQAASTSAAALATPASGIVTGLSSSIAGVVTTAVTQYAAFVMNSVTNASGSPGLTATINSGAVSSGTVILGMSVPLTQFTGATGGFAYVSSVITQTNFVVTFSQTQTWSATNSNFTIPAVFGMALNYQSQSWAQNSITGGTGVSITGNTFVYSNLFQIAQYPSWNPTTGLMTVSTSVPHGITVGTTATASIAGTQPLSAAIQGQTFTTLNGTYSVQAVSSNAFAFASANVASAYGTGTVGIALNQALPNQTQTITPTSGFATIATAQPHNIPAGQTFQALVSGVSAQPGATGTFNGTYTATSVVPNFLPPTSTGVTISGTGTSLVTVTFTAAPHNLNTGTLIVVYGSSPGGIAAFTTTTSGALPITVTSPFVFTYTLPSGTFTGSAVSTTVNPIIIQTINYLAPIQTFNVVQGGTTTVTVTFQNPHGLTTSNFILPNMLNGTSGQTFMTTAATAIASVPTIYSFTYIATSGTVNGSSYPVTYWVVPSATTNISWAGAGTTVTVTYPGVGHGIPSVGGPYTLMANQIANGAAGYNSNAAAVTVSSATVFTYQTGVNPSVTATNPATMGYFMLSYFPNAFTISTSATGTFSTLNSQTQFLTSLGFQMTTPITAVAPVMGVGSMVTGLVGNLPGTPYISAQYNTLSNAYLTPFTSNVGVLTFPVQAFSNTLVAPLTTPVGPLPATPAYLMKWPIRSITTGTTSTTVTVGSASAAAYNNFVQAAGTTFQVTIVGATGGIGGGNGSNTLPLTQFNSTYNGINGTYTATWVSASTFTIPLASPIVTAYVAGGFAYIGMSQTVTNTNASLGGFTITGVSTVNSGSNSPIATIQSGSVQANGSVVPGMPVPMSAFTWSAGSGGGTATVISVTGGGGGALSGSNYFTIGFSQLQTWTALTGSTVTVGTAGSLYVQTNVPHYIPVGQTFAVSTPSLTATAQTFSASIAGNSPINGVATVTTGAHTLTNNTFVIISSASPFNGTYAIFNVTGTTFQINTATAGTVSSSGFVTPQVTSNLVTSTGYNSYATPAYTSSLAPFVSTPGSTFFRSSIGLTVDNPLMIATSNTAGVYSNIHLVGGAFTSNMGGIATVSNFSYIQPIGIASSSAATGSTTPAIYNVTITTTNQHGLSAGMYVMISGHADSSGAFASTLNGGPYQVIAALTGTTFVIYPGTGITAVFAGTGGTVTVASGAVNYFNQTFGGGNIPGGFPVTAYQGLQSNVVNYTGFFNEARNYDRAEGFTILNGIATNGTFAHIAKGQVSFGTNADRFADTRSAINTNYTVCRRGGIFNNGQGRVQNIARFVQSQPTPTSNLVTVTTSIPHGLIPGTPILVTGWSSNVYGVNGSFFTENVYSTTTFTYTPWYGIGGATGVLGFGGSIYVQPYAYVVHRPFDGGVLLSVSVPTYGASVVRQSKKVFRYQSGKGLLWSTGTLFCPNNDLTLASSSGLTAGSTIALVTDIQHGGPQAGALVSIKGLASTGYNGAYNISNVTNTTTVTLIAPTPTAYTGIALGASSSIRGDGATATVSTVTAHGLVPGSFVAVNNTTTFTATATTQTSLPSLNNGTIIAFNCSVLGTSITVGTVLTNTPASTLGISGSPTLTVTGVTPTAVLVTVTGSTFAFTPVAGGVTLTAASGITGTYTTNGTYIVYPIYGTASTTVTQVGVLSSGTVAPAQTMTTAQLASIGIVVPASATMTSATLGTPVNGYVPITIIMSSGGYNIIAGSNIYGATMTTSAGTTLINGTYVTPTQISTSTTVTSPSGAYYNAAGYQYIVTPASLFTMGISNVFGNVLVTNATTPTSTITTTIPSYNLGMSFLTTFGSIVSGMPFNTGTGNYVQVQTVPTTTSFTYNSPANTNSATISSPGGTVISPGQYLITALSANVTAASLTTSGAHNYAVGTQVVLAGFTPSTYNGTYLVQTVPSATTFTIATTVNTVASGLGTATWNGTLTGTLVQSTISTVSADGLGTSTVTTTGAHNMVTGTVVNVYTGSGGTATFNTLTSPQVITVTSTNTFTYPNPATTTAGAGTVGTASYVTTYYAQLGNQPRFVINNWQGASVRAGCFDDQNGIFWEYDGQTVFAVKRSSTQQLSGMCSVGALGQTISGDANARFFDQLRVGDKVTIRGMTYGVSGIQTQNQFTITPPYRGTNSTLFNVKVCRVVETRVPQSQFNRDPVNGTGNSGFTFDLTKMQMIGIQYTWYGAGFIDFMIRGADGNWVYAHRFTNNNNNDEAYMRTGNQPVRYEIINETSTAVSTLAQSMYITDNYFVVNDNPTGFWPPAGTVQIENELISYSGFTTTVPYTFNVTARAAALNYSVADTNRTFRNGPAATHPMVATNSGVIGQTVNLVSCTCFPALNHWGSAFIMDGQFDQDRGYFFNYTFNQTTPIIAGVAPQALYFLRLAPSASGGSTGDTGTRDLLNRAQLLLSKLDCSAINTVNPGGTLNIQGILNPAGFDTATFPWQSMNSVIQGGQPSFCQYAVASQVTNGQYIQGSGERIFSLIAIAGAISTIDLTSLKELSSSIPGTNRIFPDGPDTLLIIASAYNQNVNSTTLNLYWSEAQA